MRTRTIVAFGLALTVVTPVVAQTSDPRGAARVTVGLVKKYLDEPADFAAGGAIRVNLPRRFGVEPEFLVSRGSRFNQWSFVPNVTFDLSGSRGRITPYVTGGVGYLHELDKSINYKRGDLTWNGGIGARLRLGGMLFAAPEFRLVDLAPRISIGLGYEF